MQQYLNMSKNYKLSISDGLKVGTVTWQGISDDHECKEKYDNTNHTNPQTNVFTKEKRSVWDYHSDATQSC